MPQIEVKIDPQLEFEPIKEIMYAPQPSEAEGARPSNDAQTKITGILTPLIQINSVVVDFDSVVSFELVSEGVLPELSLCVRDRFELIKSLDQPKGDNIIRVQIIPPFDNAYKKINLNFFISQIDIVGDLVYLTGIYKVADLYNSRLKSYGELTTYEYFEQIANETKLGLASNLAGTDDSRYIYCNNINYLESMEKEVGMGGSEVIVLNTWVDFWNYINLVDVYERYNAIDEGLKIWMSNRFVDGDSSTEPTPVELDATITNHREMKSSQLYCPSYQVSNTTGSNLTDGTDRVLSIYEHSTCESQETLLQDGDVSNDLFTKYFYLGEKFGEHNYLLTKECNKMFNQKIRSQAIEVVLDNPLLALMRGHKVNLQWYDSNTLTAQSKEQSIDTNVPMNQEAGDGIDNEESQVLNKQTSGQYLIYRVRMQYTNTNGDNKWQTRLLLVRPQSQINTYTSK